MSFQFTNSNLEFNNLLAVYKNINTNYGSNNNFNFKISSYIGCNLYNTYSNNFLTLPETDLKIEDFKDLVCIYERDIKLTIDDKFIIDNNNCYSAISDLKYVDSFNLDTAISIFFTIANKNIYTASIIIDINTSSYEFVDKIGNGALIINMNNINTIFDNFLNKVTVNILNYVTGKHGTNGQASIPGNNRTGGKGSDGGNGGEAISILNIDLNSNILLTINTHSNVSGGFGASGGDGGDGPIDVYEWHITSTETIFDDYNYWNAEYGLVINGSAYNIATDLPINVAPTSAGSTGVTHGVGTANYHDEYSYFIGFDVIIKTYESRKSDDSKEPTNGNLPSENPTLENNIDNIFQSKHGDSGEKNNGVAGVGGSPGDNGKSYSITSNLQTISFDSIVPEHLKNLIINNL